MSDIGTIIKEKRKELGLSQADLARSMGLTQGAISHWEVNERRPKLEEISKLCSILKTDFNSFNVHEPYFLPTLNVELLANAIEKLETALETKYKTLTSEQKAKLISHIYSSENEISNKEILALLQLVT